MRLIIAEKPSLARSIAAAVDGRKSSRDGYIDAGDTLITWCFGHLYELAPPDAYRSEWRSWRIETLPITIAPEQWMLLPRKDAQAQVDVIAKLLKRASEVIHAGDPDREGQLLVDEVLEMAGWKGPTKRLILLDTTEASIRKALAKMEDNRRYAPLFEAARCRQRADWLVGMNLTRAASVKIGGTLSIGRVQTPTLALVVKRDLLIESHVSKTFYTIEAEAVAGAAACVFLHDTEHGRIFDKALADGIAKRLKGRAVEVTVTAKKTTEHAPLPHKLATFQKAAEDRYGWTAKQALAALQSAYEAQLVSYPRTDCQHMPEEQAAQAVPIMTRLVQAGVCPNLKPLLALMQPSPRVYDDKKVAEHHGLAPTGKAPSKDDDAAKALLLVIEQFAKSLLPAYQAIEQEASFEFEARRFRANGERGLNAEQSWRALEPKRTRAGLPVSPLPLPIEQGTLSMQVAQTRVKEGKTTPPKPYTEATLIADMGAVHKYVDDPKIKALLKESAGIGTSATQATIIETLKQRGYIVAEKGRGKKPVLRSTRLGRYLIEHMPRALSDPGITALWEEQLDLIAKGQADPQTFMGKIDRYVASQLARIIQATYPPIPQATPDEKPRKEAPKTKKRAVRRKSAVA